MFMATPFYVYTNMGMLFITTPSRYLYILGVTVSFDPSSHDVREGEDVLVSIATDDEFSTSFSVI